MKEEEAGRRSPFNRCPSDYVLVCIGGWPSAGTIAEARQDVHRVRRTRKASRENGPRIWPNHGATSGRNSAKLDRYDKKYRIHLHERLANCPPAINHVHRTGKKARTAREWVTAASCPLAARPFLHWRLSHMHRGSATCVFILRGGTGSRAGMYRHHPNAPAWVDEQAPFAGVSSGIRAEPRL